MSGVAALMLAACGGSSSTGGGTTKHTVSVTKAGAGTVTSAPAGITCGATCAADFDAGSTVTLSAAAAVGSTFSGWTGGCVATTPTCVVTVSADKAVTATFAVVPAAKRTLRVFAWGGGTVTPAPAGTVIAPGVYAYDSGAVVTLTEAAGTGATFTGWSGDLTGTDTAPTITLSSDKIVGARFWNPATTSDSWTLPAPATGPVAQPSGTAGDLKVLDWAGFKAAVSYTFDDARVSQAIAANYDAIKAPGVPMTFYISPSQVERNLDFWKGLVTDKQEIANHTEDHCMVHADGTLVLTPASGEQGCAYPYGVPQAQQTAMDEIDAANAYIVNTIGQDGVFTFASPYGDGDWAQFAQAAGLLIHRNVVSTSNPVTDRYVLPADVGAKQFNVPGVWFGPVIEPGQTGSWGELGDTAAVINGVTDAVEAAGGWSTYLIHRVTPAPDDAADGCCAVPAADIASSMEHLKSLGDVWGGRAVDVAAYWIGQEIVSNATPVVSGGTTTWTWTLPPNFPPGKFVRVTVTGGVLSQGDKELTWDAHGYYEVALDAGELTLRTPSALKIQGTTGANAAAGEHGLTVHFAIPATDLTTGNWTVSYEYYKPAATPDTKYTARQIQFGLGAAPWTSAYWNKYDGWNDTWRPMTYNLNDATAAGSKFAGATVFNISFPYDTAVNADGTAVTWYLRNIRISDDAGHTPLNLTVTTDTDPSVASITTGTATVTIGMP